MLFRHKMYYSSFSWLYFKLMFLLFFLWLLHFLSYVLYVYVLNKYSLSSSFIVTFRNLYYSVTHVLIFNKNARQNCFSAFLQSAIISISHEFFTMCWNNYDNYEIEALKIDFKCWIVVKELYMLINVLIFDFLPFSYK